MIEAPKHLGIIIDGNRRWAKEKGLSSLVGHRKGAELVKKVIIWCKNRGIKILTFFVFSTENWSRSKTEISYLMRLLKQAFLSKKYTREISKEGIRVRVIGQKERLTKPIQKMIKETEKLTKNNEKMVLNFAMSYGGRAEIVEAVKNIIRKKIPPEKITEETIKENLWTSDLDFLIRTGGEQRISNFLIWQAAYSELYFCPKYWPDFTEKDLDEILVEYSRRERRLGK